MTTAMYTKNNTQNEVLQLLYNEFKMGLLFYYISVYTLKL